jgi:hypothetical protein
VVSRFSTKLCFFLFSLIFLSVFQSEAQSVSIPLPGQAGSIQKPASDLFDPKAGKVLDVGEAAKLAEQGLDLSNLNPTVSKMWQTKPLALSNSSDLSYPPASRGVKFLGVEAATRYTVLARVQSVDNPNLFFRLGVSRLTQPMMMRAALLRRLGYPLPSPKNYSNLTIRFSSEEEKNAFVLEAEQNVGDFATRGWVLSDNKQDHSLVLASSSLEIVSSEYFDLQWGLAPNPDYPEQLPIVQRFSRNRAYRALLIPYMLVDVPESVNRFSGQFGSVASGHVILGYPMANSFAACTYSDARWVLKKLAGLSMNDFRGIVNEAGYPAEISELVLAKLLSRAHDAMLLFGLEVPKHWQKFDLKINSSSGAVKNGKVTVEFIKGYPQRFSHGDRPSPYEEGDFGRYLKVEAITNAVQHLMTKMNERLQIQTVSDLALKYQQEAFARFIDRLRTNPREAFHREVTSWGGWIGGLNVNSSRHIATGTYYGSNAAVQLVDNISVSGGLGYFRSLDGLKYLPSASANVAVVRDYTHVRPILSIKEGSKITWENLLVPRFMKQISSVLKDENYKKADGTSQSSLDYFLSELRDGEVFTVTDSVALSAGIRALSSLDVLLGITPFSFINSLTVGGDASRVILRQTQFVKTGRGVQVYVREMKNKGAGLEMSLNFYLELIKIRSELTKSSILSQVYSIDYSPELIGSISDPEAPKAKELLKTRASLRAALLPLLRSNDTELLDSKFVANRFTLDHQFVTQETKTQFLAKKFASFKEEHHLDILYPRSQKHPELNPEDEKISLYSYKKGELVGRDLLGFFFDIINGVLANKNSEVSIHKQITQNPANVPFGKAKWRVITAETDVSEKVQQAPNVAMMQHVWGGWKIDRRKFFSILDEIDLDFQQGQGEPPLINRDAFLTMKSLDFYRITQNLSVLDGGVQKLRDLIAQPEFRNTPGNREKNPIVRIFQKLSEAGGNKSKLSDPELFKSVLKMLGNGDSKLGQERYQSMCLEEFNKRQGSGESYGQTPPPSWYYGTNYECLTSWMQKLIELSRKFPAEKDKKAQSRWLVEVLIILDDKIPLKQMLSYLGQDNYVFVVRINGFRSGDEDGDLEYFSSTSGDPREDIDYANGLFQMYAKKTRIMPNELDRTQGGF